MRVLDGSRLLPTLHFGSPLGAQFCSPLGDARFLVDLAFPHLLLNPGPLHQLAETTHCLLNRLPIPNHHFDHMFRPSDY